MEENIFEYGSVQVDKNALIRNLQTNANNYIQHNNMSEQDRANFLNNLNYISEGIKNNTITGNGFGKFKDSEGNLDQTYNDALIYTELIINALGKKYKKPEEPADKINENLDKEPFDNHTNGFFGKFFKSLNPYAKNAQELENAFQVWKSGFDDEQSLVNDFRQHLRNYIDTTNFSNIDFSNLSGITQDDYTSDLETLYVALEDGLQDTDRYLMTKVGLGGLYSYLQKPDLTKLKDGSGDGSGEGKIVPPIVQTPETAADKTLAEHYGVNTDSPWYQQLMQMGERLAESATEAEARRFKGLLADIISIIDPEPVSAAAISLYSDYQNLQADNLEGINDNYWDDAGNVALSIAGAFPVIGDIAVGAKASKKIKQLSGIITKLGIAAGVLGTISYAPELTESYTKLVNGDISNMTVDDWGNVWTAFQMALGVTNVGTRMAGRKKYNRMVEDSEPGVILRTEKGDMNIKNSDDPELAKVLSRGSVEDAKRYVSKHYDTTLNTSKVKNFSIGWKNPTKWINSEEVPDIEQVKFGRPASIFSKARWSGSENILRPRYFYRPDDDRYMNPKHPISTWSRIFSPTIDKQGGVLKANQGIKFTKLQDNYQYIPEYNYDTWGYINGDAWNTFANASAGNTYNTYKTSGTSQLIKDIENQDFYKQQTAAFFNADGTLTEIGKNWAKKYDASLPENHSRRIFDNTGNLKTKWESNNRTFNDVKSYIEHLRFDGLEGPAHNSFQQIINKHAYKDANGQLVFIERPENLTHVDIETSAQPGILTNTYLYTLQDDQATQSDEKEVKKESKKDGKKESEIQIRTKSGVKPKGKPLDSYDGTTSKLPYILESYKYFKTLKHNKEQLKLQNELTPLLYNPNEDYKYVQGDLQSLVQGHNAAAQLAARAIQPITSDAQLQLANQYEAFSKGLDYIYAGNKEDADMQRKTSESSQQQEKENHANRYAIASKNLENQFQIDKEKLMAFMAKVRSDYDSQNNFINQLMLLGNRDFEAKESKNKLVYSLQLDNDIKNNPQNYIINWTAKHQQLWDKYRSGESITDKNELYQLNQIQALMQQAYYNRLYADSEYKFQEPNTNDIHVGQFVPKIQDREKGGKITKDVTDAVIKFLKESNNNYNKAIDRSIRGLYNHIKLQRKK